jgi:hypothetical protein
MKKLSFEKIEKIERLIPFAISKANQSIDKVYLSVREQNWPTSVKNEWNIVYHVEMDKLAKKEGLRV